MNNFVIKYLGIIMAFIFILLLVWVAGETDKETVPPTPTQTIEIVGKTDLK